MNHLQRLLSSALLFVFSLVCHCTCVSNDVAWEALRQSALERPRRLLWNNDGGDLAYWPKELPLTMENLPRRLNYGTDIAAGPIDTLVYNPLACGFCRLTTDTKYGDRIADEPSSDDTSLNAAQYLISQGTDTLRVAQEYARANGLEFFASMRMNDIHDNYWANGQPKHFPKFKMEHPEFLFGSLRELPLSGSWTMVDYAHPEVRERMLNCLREFCENYDIDGLDLDFGRDPLVLKSVAVRGTPALAEEKALVTGFMREIRAMAEEVGHRRGRPILISVRVPSAPQFLRAAALDVDQWFREGLADILVADNWVRLEHLQESFAVPRKCGAKCYAGIDNIASFRISADSDNWRAWTRAEIAEAMAAQADGAYLYNWFSPEQALVLATYDMNDIRGRDKLYQATPSGFEILVPHFMRNGLDYARRAVLSDRLPFHLSTANACEVTFDMVDDFAEQWIASLNPVVTATLCQEGDVDAGQVVSLAVNGHAPILPSVVAPDGKRTYEIPATYLRCGRNSFALSLTYADGQKPQDGEGKAAPRQRLLMSGGDFLRGSRQAPWRRIKNENPGMESAEGDALRLRNSCPDFGYSAQLLYPLALHSGTAFRFSFDLKVLESPTPDAVVMRLANGRGVEVIRFQPGEVALKYAGLSAPFATTDDFHRYVVEVAEKAIAVYGDGRLLVRGEMPMAADALEAAIPEARCNDVPLRDAKSLVIGSLLGSDGGDALWRNLRMDDDGILLSDFQVRLHFEEAVSQRLLSAAEDSAIEWLGAIGVHDGTRTMQGVENGYLERLLVTGDDSLRLIHDDADQRWRFQMMHFTHPALATAGAPQVLEWEARVLKPGVLTPEGNALMAIASPTNSRGRRLNLAVVHMAADGVYACSSSRIALDCTQFHRFRLVFAADSREYALWIDGRLAAWGRSTQAVAATEPNSHHVGIGDGSGGVDGQVELRFARAGILKQ